MGVLMVCFVYNMCVHVHCVCVCVQETAKARTDLIVNFREVLDSMTRLASAYYFLCEEGELCGHHFHFYTV